MITFQVSTDYLPKMSLRLETLYEHIQQSTSEKNPALHHFALLHALEIMKLIEKPELKSRFLKEFMRIEYVYSRTPDKRNESLFEDLHQTIQLLTHQTGRMGEGLFGDPLLQSIRQYQTYGQQEFELDSPPLLFWLEGPTEQRQSQLSRWLNDINPLYQTVKFYLSLLRNAAQFETVKMHHGYYQQFVSNKKTNYLILLRIEPDLNLVPKIQIGHHGIHIRFYDAFSMKEKNTAAEQFELAISYLC